MVGYRREHELLKVQVEVTQSQLDKDSLIRSDYTGYASSNYYAPGDFIIAGDKLATIEPDQREIVTVAMFPARLGKRIKVGSKAYISPTSVAKEKYGTIQGVVTDVTNYAVSTKAMENFFASDNLVKTLSKMDSPIAVEISLVRDRSTKSGYKWTNGKGPDRKISEGTLVSANVIIKQQAPVELLIPFLKKLIGVGS